MYVELVEHRNSLTDWDAYAARFDYAVTTFTTVRELLLVRSTPLGTSSLVMSSVSSSKSSSMSCLAMLRAAWLFLTTNSGKIQSFGTLSVYWHLFSEAKSFHDWYSGRKEEIIASHGFQPQSEEAATEEHETEGDEGR